MFTCAHLCLPVLACGYLGVPLVVNDNLCRKPFLELVRQLYLDFYLCTLDEFFPSKCDVASHLKAFVH